MLVAALPPSANEGDRLRLRIVRPALAERGLVRVGQFFHLLNERLADRDFIATDRFSVADITAVVAVDFARVVKHKPGEQHPHLLRWRAAMAQRLSMSL